MRSLTSVAYHLPMSSHAANPLGTRPPAGKKVTTIWLRTPIRGGMPGSCLTLLTSFTVHLQRLFPDSTDLVSEEFSQEALNSQAGESCGGNWLSFTGSSSWNYKTVGGKKD